MKFDELVQNVQEGTDRWLIRVHSPVEVGSGLRQVICRRCRTSYPCDDLVEVVERRDARRAGTG